MRYIMFVIDSQTRSVSDNEMAAIDKFNEMAAIDKFNDDLRAAGQWVMAAGIGAPRTATVFDNRSGASQSTDGSLFEDDDFYSGFWVIEADSPETARELAKRGSHACSRRVELRPFLR